MAGDTRFVVQHAQYDYLIRFNTPLFTHFVHDFISTNGGICSSAQSKLVLRSTLEHYFTPSPLVLKS